MKRAFLRGSSISSRAPARGKKIRVLKRGNVSLMYHSTSSVAYGITV